MNALNFEDDTTVPAQVPDSTPKQEPAAPVARKKPGPKPKPKPIVEVAPAPAPVVEPKPTETETIPSYNFVPPPRNLTGRVVVIDVMSLMDLDRAIEAEGSKPSDISDSDWILSKLESRKFIYRIPKSKSFISIMALASRARAGGAEIATIASLEYPKAVWRDNVNRWLMANASYLGLIEDYIDYIGSGDAFEPSYPLGDIHIVTPDLGGAVTKLFANHSVILASDHEEPMALMKAFMPREIQLESVSSTDETVEAQVI